MQTEFYYLFYLAVGVVLAIASSRRLNVYDKALALVLFWPLFVIVAMAGIAVRAVEGFIMIIVNRVKAFYGRKKK